MHSCTAYIGLCSKGGSDGGELCLPVEGEGGVSPLWVPPGRWAQTGFTSVLQAAFFRIELCALDSLPQPVFRRREIDGQKVCAVPRCSFLLEVRSRGSERIENSSSEIRLMEGCHWRTQLVYVQSVGAPVLVLNSGAWLCNGPQGASPSRPVGSTMLCCFEGAVSMNWLACFRGTLAGTEQLEPEQPTWSDMQ